MLSYLRDPNQELPAEQEENSTPQQEEKDILTVATKGKDVKRSTTVLGVLFIIGLICLGIMIKKSAPQQAVASTNENTEELQIEMAIAKLMGIRNDVFGKMDEIVDKFYEFSDVFQIEVDGLAKNPFQLESIIQTLNNNSEDNVATIDAEMIMREQMKIKAKDMKIYSIMESEKGVCCMIDNKILYEGDNIEDFIVKKINNDSVLLDMEGIEITLKMSK